MTILNGHDVSKWQNGNLPSGDFCIAKATQGTVEIDPFYGNYLSHARSAHMLYGSYHYANGTDPHAEAHFYVAHNQQLNGEIQALDFEGDVLSIGDPVGWALTWLQTVEALTKNKPLIYLSQSTVDSHDWSKVIANNTGLWVAKWSTQEPVETKWPFAAIWQNSDGNGKLDTDVFHGDRAAWLKYGSSTPPLDHIPPTHPQPPTTRYMVVKGDTLSSIAERFHTTWQILATINHLHDPNLIYPGQVLALRGAAPAPHPVRSYIVVSGDTLSEIASKYHTTWQTLASINHLANPNLIFPGQHLIVG